jgi:hypothetical protein
MGMRLGFIASLLLLVSACGASNVPVEAPIATSSHPSGATEAKKYTIKFGRSAVVGERVHLVLDQHEDMTTKVRGGAATPQTEHKVTVRHFDAVQTVLAVDEHGRGTRLRYQVKELMLNGEPLRVQDIDLTRGERKEDAIILADGRPAGPELRAPLGDLLKLRVGGSSDDDVFGTDAPQPIGAHWAVRQDIALASLKEDGMSASRAKGEVWLEGLTKADDMDCTRVKATLELDGIRLPDMPAGAQVEEARASAQMEAALPIDNRVERASDRLTMHMTFRMRIPQGQGDDITVVVTGDNASTARFTPLPARGAQPGR